MLKKTDIPVNAANFDVLFITGGLSETLTQETKTPEDIAAILRDYDYMPLFYGTSIMVTYGIVSRHFTTT